MCEEGATWLGGNAKVVNGDDYDSTMIAKVLSWLSMGIYGNNGGTVGNAA